jgi:hypothetical protein
MPTFGILTEAEAGRREEAESEAQRSHGGIFKAGLLSIKIREKSYT